MAVTVQVVGVDNIVEVVSTPTVQTIEVHPTEISPPGPVGPKGDKGEKGDGVPSGGMEVLARNLAWESQANFLGGPQIESNVSYDGILWRKMTTTAANQTIRYLVPLDQLNSNSYYTASIEVANNSDTSISFSVDWCDYGNKRLALLPWERRRVYVTARKPEGYDAVYRFMDIHFTGNVGRSILFRNPMVVEGHIENPFFNGDTPGARWTGTPGASVSELILARKTDTPLVAGFTSPQKTNLITNPSFEIDTNGWSSRWFGGSGGTGTSARSNTGLNGGWAFRKTWTASGASLDTGFNSHVPVTPGQTLTGSAWFRSNKQIYCKIFYQFLDVSGNTIGSITNGQSPDYVAQANTWGRCYAPPINVPSNAVRATVIISPYNAINGNWSPGDWLEIDNVLVENSSRPSEYFDGESSGAFWTDRPHNSESKLYIPRASDIQEYASEKVRYIEGTGFPEGVVSASVGTRYIDTAATNGAIEWIKHSGVGNTGWRVSNGDTGWRNLDSIVDKTKFSVWNSPGFKIRRVNDNVYISVVDLTTLANLPSNTTFFVVPPGFRHTGSNYAPLLGLNINTFNVAPFRIAASYHATPYALVNAGTFNSVRFAMETQYAASDLAWPTILPGVAG